MSKSVAETRPSGRVLQSERPSG